MQVHLCHILANTHISIEKSDAFFGTKKITFGENAENLVKYGEFSESVRFRPRSRKCIQKFIRSQKWWAALNAVCVGGLRAHPGFSDESGIGPRVRLDR